MGTTERLTPDMKNRKIKSKCTRVTQFLVGTIKGDAAALLSSVLTTKLKYEFIKSSLTTQCASEDCRLSPAAFTGRRKEKSPPTDFCLQSFIIFVSYKKIDVFKLNPPAPAPHCGLTCL